MFDAGQTEYLLARTEFSFYETEYLLAKTEFSFHETEYLFAKTEFSFVKTEFTLVKTHFFPGKMCRSFLLKAIWQVKKRVKYFLKYYFMF